MNIAFIGYGGMTAALASKWQQRHTLFIAGRDQNAAALVAQRFGARSGTIQDAIRFGDVIVLAVPGDVAEAAVRNAAPATEFDDKVVIDITNPIDIQTFTTTRRDGRSVTEAVAAMLPGAKVGKAFNMAHTSVWENVDMLFDGRRLNVLYTAADGAADTIAALIVDTGAQPVHLGSNAHAYQLEAAAAMVIKFLFAGNPPSTVLNLADQNSPNIESHGSDLAQNSVSR